MRRDPKTALLGAAACLAGLVATGLAAKLWPAAQARDADALAGIVTLDRGGLSLLAEGLVHLADPRPYAVFGAGLAAIALLRGRRRLALALPVVLVGAPLTSEVLKPLLAAPRPDGWLENKIGIASWPSGHATAALALARPEDVGTFAAEHTTGVAMLAVIAALALALAGGVVQTLRR